MNKDPMERAERFFRWEVAAGIAFVSFLLLNAFCLWLLPGLGKWFFVPTLAASVFVFVWVYRWGERR
jgi:hypothetical protein